MSYSQFCTERDQYNADTADCVERERHQPHLEIPDEYVQKNYWVEVTLNGGADWGWPCRAFCKEEAQAMAMREAADQLMQPASAVAYLQD